MRIPAAMVGKTSCVHLRKTDNNRAKATQCSESVQSVHGNARAREAREVYVRHCSLLRPPQRPRRLQARPDACRQPPAPHSGNRTRSDGRAQRPSRRLTLRRSPPMVEKHRFPFSKSAGHTGTSFTSAHVRTPQCAREKYRGTGFPGREGILPSKGLPLAFAWRAGRPRSQVSSPYTSVQPNARTRETCAHAQLASAAGFAQPAHARDVHGMFRRRPAERRCLRFGSSGTGLPRAAIPLQRQGVIGAEIQKPALNGWRPTRRPSPSLPASCRLRPARRRVPPPPAMILAAAHRLARRLATQGLEIRNRHE